jgi:hypothetical protein
MVEAESVLVCMLLNGRWREDALPVDTAEYRAISEPNRSRGILEESST